MALDTSLVAQQWESQAGEGVGQPPGATGVEDWEGCDVVQGFALDKDACQADGFEGQEVQEQDGHGVLPDPGGGPG